MPQTTKASCPEVVAIEIRRSPAIHPPFRTGQVLHGLAVAGAHSTTPTAKSRRGKAGHERPVAVRNPQKQAIGKGRLVLAYMAMHMWRLGVAGGFSCFLEMPTPPVERELHRKPGVYASNRYAHALQHVRIEL